ncbi:permease, partial [gut metagenome]
MLSEALVQYPALETKLNNASNLDWQHLIETVFEWAKRGGIALVGGAANAATGIVSGMFDFFIGMIFALYILSQKETLQRQGKMLLYAYLPERRASQIISILRLTFKTFSNFLSGQCLEACILGGMFAVSMIIFRMPFVALISVLVAVTALVPVFGAFIGCFVGAFLILVQNPMQAVWFVVMFLVLQQLEGNLIYPRVVGNSVGLPSIWVLLAVTLGGSTLGVLGMLITIPLFSVIYALLRGATHTRLRHRKIPRDAYLKTATEKSSLPPAVSSKKM